MLTFFVIVFLTFYLTSLIQGSSLYRMQVKLSEILTKRAVVISLKNKAEVDELNKEMIAIFLPAIWFLLLGVIEMIVILALVTVDPLKIPTLIMILYAIFCFVKGGVKQNKEQQNWDTIEGVEAFKAKIKRYSIKSLIVYLLNSVYYLYMLIVLVAPYLLGF